MAYNKDKIYKEVIKAIDDNKLKHFSHIESFIEPSLKTLKEWNWDNGECSECATIKRKLIINKIEAKIKMSNKWENSDNPTLQIAAFKLIATDEERKCLSSTFIDHTSAGKELKSLTDTEREEKIQELKKKLGITDE